MSPFRFEPLNLIKVSDVLQNSILVLPDGNAVLVSFPTFILVEISSRQERFAEVSPVRFDVLNSKTVVDVQQNLILVLLDGITLLVSFQSLILVENASKGESGAKKCHLSGSIR